MRQLDRQGLTLVELLLVLALTLATAGAAHQVVRLAAGTALLARAHNAASRDAIAVWALLNHDLRAAARDDLAAPHPNSLEMPRPVGEGPVCQQTATATRIRWHGERAPDQDRDRAWLLVDSNTTWLERGIVSVTVANCADGGPALELGLAGTIPPVAVVRVAEPSQLRSYLSGGEHWLGLEPTISTASIQPLAGPIAADGFHVSLTTTAVQVRYSRAPLSPLKLSLPLESPP